jgi:Uri superfamily endonuclease
MKHLLREKGTYTLVLHLQEETHFGRIGPFGAVTLPAGHYTYTGSAHGAGGGRGRIGHHLRFADRPHWHLDWVRPAMDIIEAWVTYDGIKRECAWSRLVHEVLGGSPIVAGMGSADCDLCPAHFYAFAARPSFARFRKAVLGRLPGHADVGRVRLMPEGCRRAETATLPI